MIGRPRPPLPTTNRAYQDRDRVFIDYRLAYLAEVDAFLRGPVPSDLAEGQFGVCLGAAQTFGACAQSSFPQLLGDQLGLPMLNLGFPGPGPRFFTRQPKLIALANRARFVVVQVLSGRSVANSCFACPEDNMMLQWLAGPQAGQAIDALHGYMALIETRDESTLLALVEETRRNWIAQTIALLQAISAPKILLYYSTRMPDYVASTRSVLELMGDFPQFIDGPTLAAVKPHAEAYVDSIGSRGLPQRLVNRFTGAPCDIAIGFNAPPGYNVYYPTIGMHRQTAMLLAAKILQLGMAPT